LEDKIIIKISYKGNRYAIYRSSRIYDEQRKKFLDETKDFNLISNIRNEMTSGYTDIIR